MLILNFTHPLTEENKAQIESLAGSGIEEIRTIPVQIDQAQPLEQQVSTIVDEAQLSSEEWHMKRLPERIAYMRNLILKSARVQREEYIGPWLPEPVLTVNPEELAL